MKRLLVAAALVAASCSATNGEEAVPTTVAPEPVEPMTAAELATEIDVLMERVEEIRGLDFITEPEVEIVTRDELLRRYLASDQVADPDADAYTARLYALLGVVDEGADIDELFADFDSTSVTGFYDWASGSLTVAAPETTLTPLARITLVHELVHSLTDQHFDHSGTLTRLWNKGRMEEAAAFEAVIEGDAEFFATAYAASDLTPTEQFAAQLEGFGYSGGEEVVPFPAYFEETALFPYEAGFSFVEELVSVGGIEAVNDAYAAGPVTTEQVYHPARFAGGESAVAVDVPALDVAGYRLYEAGVWGELGYRALFADVLSAAEVLQAGTGWGGDSYATWWDGRDVVLVMVYAGDDEKEAREHADALRRWVLNAMPVGGGRSDWKGLVYEGVEAYAFVGHAEDEVLFVAATDPDAGSSVRDRFFPEY